MNGHPSDLALDAGGPDTAGHIAACAACGARLAETQALVDEFRREVLPRTIAGVRARVAAARAPRRIPRLIFFAGPLLAAAGIAIVVGRIDGGRIDGGDPARDTPGAVPGIKGAFPGEPDLLEIVIKRDGGIFRLVAGTRIRGGDALRFVYRGRAPRHVALLVRAADGTLVRFFPESGPAPRMRPGDALPGAALVDGKPGAEIVIVRTSPRPFDADDRANPDVLDRTIEIPKERSGP